ncbi:coagulation factor V [Notolabrus celidotus]|uniref:coagulation factor V n=1 Tax=Notolabrus celidotus TaxID=1203425 RepID=UPI0014900726|nr:coagulation factor V [Notolabrus celidotus]
MTHSQTQESIDRAHLAALIPDMRLCFWAGAPCLLLILVLLTDRAEQHQLRERHYYIAAVEIEWDYSGNDSHRSGPTYQKVVFREYEKDFRQAKTHPSWLGLLGPTLRAEEGETIVVTFRNMARGPHSIHPHGIAYGKQSEGAHYFDNTSQKEKEDDVVAPNSEHVYYWEVTPEVSPQPSDPSCLTYTYISHQNVVEDYNSGLIGTLLICKPGSLDESGKQVSFHHEYTFLFGVFDEKESKHKANSFSADNHVKYTINGYTLGSLPDVSMCANAPVSLHLLGMSSEPEVFSVHLNGQVLQQTGHKVSSVGLISGSSTTASMKALHPGRWLLSSHTTKHMEAGMHGFVDVNMCDAFKPPRRRLTINQKRHSMEWKYYIAAEEVIWDYAPEVHDHVDEDFKFKYLRQSPTRIGKSYKKAVYTLYKNESFTEKLESKQRKDELGILGPVLRAQIRDVIKIVFKNMASRPYSIYPHGLSIEKSEEGSNYPPGGNHSHGVQPGETHTYVWSVLEEDEPLVGDHQCLTRLYHSAVDTPRDIASGLIGPILICKSQSLNVRNVQLKADKEQHAMLAVFDENKSWYLDQNIRQNCDRTKINKADPEFYKSNVMHTINGYVFESGPTLGFCNGEITTWHVLSAGAQDYIQTATFYGHPFELNERTEDFLSLYPMTGETISMNMDNVGVWLLATLNSHETMKGMRSKFQDVVCIRDYQYEYNDYDDESKKYTGFTVWNPKNLTEIKKEEEKAKIEKETKPVETDAYTDMFAAELNLRSLKNQSKTSSVELLDLSFLDYDAVDVPDGDPNRILKVIKNKIKGDAAKPSSNAKSEAGLSKWKEVDARNLTALNQSTSENSPTNATLDNSTAVKPENTTSLNSANVSLKNETITTNATNATASPILGNVSAEITNLTEALQENTNLTEALQENTNLTEALQENTNLTEALQENTNLTEALQENTYLTEALQGNSSSDMEIERTNITLSADNQTLVEGSEKKLIKVDEFSLSEPLPDLTTNSVNNSQDSNVENNTAAFHANVSADGTNHSSPIPMIDVEEVEIKGTESHNFTFLMLELENNKTSDNDSQILEDGLQMNTSENVNTSSNVSLGNLTHTLEETLSSQNLTEDSQRLNSSLDDRSNVTTLLNKFNQTSSSSESSSNDTVSQGNLTLSRNDTSDDFSSFESDEEIVIYLRENEKKMIKTKTVKTQEYNWTYDGTHQEVAMEIPDEMMKYLGKEIPQTTPAPKKTKRVNLRQKPLKGQGMKTRRKKEYKAQARSGLPFSPRGFNPGMSPRGARPSSPQLVSDEEELINTPVVIGVPRPDFSDYELYIPGDEPDHLDRDSDVTENEYEYVIYKDPYSEHTDIKNMNLDETAKYYLKFSGQAVKTYFIAAEEVDWDYAGYGQRRQDKSHPQSRETKFTKVVFRGYMDNTFRTPEIRGEMNEHLGILGPVIKAEVGQSIMVVFKNNANRPFSLHPNGVFYTKQTEGLAYEDGSKYWYQYDNEVKPNTTFTYIWKVSPMVGPTEGESHCRTWAYYSGVNPEKDINSGLIGPLLVCREGTLKEKKTDTREFMLLFMTFDESQSWYYEENRELIQRKSRRRSMDPNFRENLKFHSINGITFNLKGLRMYTNQLVTWHLINMGSPRDYQSVHFHGQTFLYKKTTSYRQAIYPLLPGSFATLEMYPSKPGLWQLETEVGFNQQKGMQTLFLVLDNECYRPLGLESCSVKDDQFTATNTRGYWEPHLARLNNPGKYNAWSTGQNYSWVQVDFQRPVVISQVATQGAKQLFHSQFVTKYYISYSTDRRNWIFYKGDSRDFRKAFPGNQEAYEINKNVFFPPLIGRFIRFHPVEWYGMATVRMEFYGCELDGCSVPLGMETGLIEDRRITASSTASSWYSGPWQPGLARLNKQGTINAWQAKYSDMNQWLQVELPQVKKITGIITQGAKSLGKEMYVLSYALMYSDNGIHWNKYTDDENISSKTFRGNTDNNDHVKNYIYPPIFSRFIRIVPMSWMGSITMRIELLGCDFE